MQFMPLGDEDGRIERNVNAYPPYCYPTIVTAMDRQRSYAD